jgi:hypothetical protein
MASEQTKQLHIIHLTDLHFGEDHRFMAPAPVSGASVIRPGFPSLLSKLKEDFDDPKPIDNRSFALRVISRPIPLTRLNSNEPSNSSATYLRLRVASSSRSCSTQHGNGRSHIRVYA